MKNLIKTIKQTFCKHAFQWVWLDDYKFYILGKPRAKYQPHVGKFAIRYCPKCGKTMDGYMIPSTDIKRANEEMIYNIGSNGHYKEVTIP